MKCQALFHMKQQQQSKCLCSCKLLFKLYNSLGFLSSKLLIFFLFFLDKRFDISCKLSQLEIIYMKCQIVFLGKIKKKCFKMSYAENFTQHAQF